MTNRATLLRRLLRLAALGSTVVFVLALTGYALRDRTRWLAMLMYLPMPLIAPAAILVQLFAWERGRRIRRIVIILLATMAALLSVRGMRGTGIGTRYVGPDAIRVVQWNVQWGRDADGWMRTAAAIEFEGPDVIVLSEAPSDDKLSGLCKRLGDGWTYQIIRNPAGSRYWYAIAVLSRSPNVIENQPPLPNGAGMTVRIDLPNGALRMLAVDGQSDPKISRTPLLSAVAAITSGGTIDMAAGDFNAVSRSVGFDAIRSQGFRLGAEHLSGWRGTYPAEFPIYDIDHIWIGPRYFATDATALHSPGTNHRGQSVTIRRLN